MANVEEEGADVDVELRIKMSNHRNNVLLRKPPQLKLVKLPNGRTFYAGYQRVNRQILYQTKVRIKRTYVRKTGPKRQKKRRAQTGSGYLDAILMRGINLAERGANTELGKTIIDDAVGLLPKAYNSIIQVFGCKKNRKQHHQQVIIRPTLHLRLNTIINL